MRLPGGRPLGGRRRGGARGGRGLLSGFRRGAAGTTATERQRQPADAGDTPPRHHSPSVGSQDLSAPHTLASIIDKGFTQKPLKIEADKPMI